MLLYLSLLSLPSLAQENPISYTQADRDRLVRLETKVEGVDKRIDDIHLQINRLEDKFDSYFMWGFGLALMSIFGLIGFVIYDRRTTLAPVESKTRSHYQSIKRSI